MRQWFSSSIISVHLSYSAFTQYTSTSWCDRNHLWGTYRVLDYSLQQHVLTFCMWVLHVFLNVSTVGNATDKLSGGEYECDDGRSIQGLKRSITVMCTLRYRSRSNDALMRL